LGTPRELYDHPVNRYVADFVGKSNMFVGPREGTVLSVRPEMIELSGSRRRLPKGLAVVADAIVLNRIFVGEFTHYRLASVTLGEFAVQVPRKTERESGTFEIGDNVAAGWAESAALVLADV
jgi:spermidine/putrescine transport system ATP-binding protein